MTKPAPNILFFFPDQWRHDWTGLNPDLDLRTPNLLRLAREGVVFSDAICPSPLCAPSRACLALGVEYEHCPVQSNREDLPLDRVTVYQRLRDAGYHTMGCGKFDLHKATFRWGLDGKTDLDTWGFDDGIDNEGKCDAFVSDREGLRGPYMHALEQQGLREMHHADFWCRDKWSTHTTPLPDEAYCDNWIGQNGLDLLDRAPKDKPWFLQVNFTGPHSPWDVTERMRERVKDRDLPMPVHSSSAADPRALEIRRNYAAMIENIDRWVGVYLDRLEARGELENTLIVFSSDHGEMLLDHDRWAKGIWRHASLNVPLIVRGPGVVPGRVVEAPAAILDLVATFLDMAGESVPEDMDSRSLGPVLSGQTEPARDRICAGLTTPKTSWRTVVTQQWKAVREQDALMLFDREQDPEECCNLADEFPEILRELDP